MKSLGNLKRMVMDGMLVQSQIDKFNADGILKNPNNVFKESSHSCQVGFSPLRNNMNL